jgi:hypothetical protein
MLINLKAEQKTTKIPIRHKQKRAVKYKNKNSNFLHMPKEGFNAFHHTLVQSVGAQVKW